MGTADSLESSPSLVQALYLNLAEHEPLPRVLCVENLTDWVSQWDQGNTRWSGREGSTGAHLGRL